MLAQLRMVPVFLDKDREKRVGFAVVGFNEGDTRAIESGRTAQ